MRVKRRNMFSDYVAISQSVESPNGRMSSSRTIARVLELNYVYYSIAVHPRVADNSVSPSCRHGPYATIEDPLAAHRL